MYTLWKPSTEYLRFVPEPSITVAYWATFALAQLPGVIFVARRASSQFLHATSVRLLLGLLVWLVVTSFFSTLARKSIPEVTALLLTTGFGFYLAINFRFQSVLWQILTAMVAGSLWSYIAVVRLWEGSRRSEEHTSELQSH